MDFEFLYAVDAFQFRPLFARAGKRVDALLFHQSECSMRSSFDFNEKIIISNVIDNDHVG